MDTVDRATRSRMMAAVRSKNTAAEVEIRRRIFRLGFRYRLHGRGLPGKPDMVFPKHRAVVFVNGCFWHNHDCRFGALPATRRKWWTTKLEGNRKRDVGVLSQLHRAGWRTMVVWECSYRTAGADRANALDAIAGRVGRFLKSGKTHAVISGSRMKTARVRHAGG
ncbi:MAG: DNA mismatch endonuclease Vsr [Phycisphaerae bacterium]|nr:DNA mismatch endonuclease Vsr [Phycisphaerae bacterium]